MRRTGLIPDELLETAGKPVHLMTASQQQLTGGKRIVKIEMIFSGFCEKSGEAVTVKAPCHLLRLTSQTMLLCPTRVSVNAALM